MRVWGRVYAADDSYVWQAVETDANGNNDSPSATWFLQCCALSPGESPFFGDWGIPGQQAVIQQIFPDYYISLMQQRFAPYFASLLIAKNPGTTPSYNITIITHQGVKITGTLPQ